MVRILPNVKDLRDVLIKICQKNIRLGNVFFESEIHIKTSAKADICGKVGGLGLFLWETFR